MSSKDSKVPVRPSLRLERVALLLQKKLEAESNILDELVADVAKGSPNARLWPVLHDAAVRDGRVDELALAYDNLIQSRKLKVLSPAAQAEVMTYAAAFHEEKREHIRKARELLERALSVSNAYGETFDRLESLLIRADEMPALLELYAAQAQARSSIEDKLTLFHKGARQCEQLLTSQTEELARGSTQVGQLFDCSDHLRSFYQQIVKLDPADHATTMALFRLHEDLERHPEAAKVLEGWLVAPIEHTTEGEREAREHLLALYRDNLLDPERAFTHAEQILAHAGSHSEARAMVESMLAHKTLASRAASALAGAHEQLGNFEAATALWSLELSQAKGARRAQVVRHLALLRQDRLGDLPAAFQSMAEVLEGDPGDEEIVLRYRQLGDLLLRPREVLALLSRLAESTTDVARARLLAEVAELRAEQGDRDGASAAWGELLHQATADNLRLRAARGVTSSRAETPELLALALRTQLDLEGGGGKRAELIHRLAHVLEVDLRDPAGAIAAYELLRENEQSDPSIDALQRLYEGEHRVKELVLLLGRRAEREFDPERARTFALQAAERSEPLGAEEQLDRYLAIASAHGPSREVNHRVLALARTLGRADPVIHVLESELELAPREEHMALHVQLGLARVSAGDTSKAMDHFRWVLQQNPGEAAVRKVLHDMLQSREDRSQAAELLEPLYENEGNHEALLRVLNVRANASGDPAERLAILTKGVHLLEHPLHAPSKALGLAGQALIFALQKAPELAASWLSRAIGLSARVEDRGPVLEILHKALDLASPSSALFADLAETLGGLLEEADRHHDALAVYERALSSHAGSARLEGHLERLVISRGSELQKISLLTRLLESAEDDTRRQDLREKLAQACMACGERARAIDLWKQLLVANPQSVVAHHSLLRAFEEDGNDEALYAELLRGSGELTERARAERLLRLAAAAFRTGRVNDMRAHLTEALAEQPLTVAELEEVERLARSSDEVGILCTVLTRRIDLARAPGEAALLAEQLGDLFAERLGDTASAVTHWQRALACAEESRQDEGLLRRLYERLLRHDPENREVAEKLVQLYAKGSSGRPPAAQELLVRSAKDEREAADLVLRMEGAAIRGGTVKDFADAVDNVLERYIEAVSRKTGELLAAKARALATVPEHADEAAALFRGLIATSREDAHVLLDSFESFLSSSTITEERREDQRWLLAFRAHQVPELDRARTLMATAAAHEAVGDTSAAVEAYRRVLHIDPERISARFAIARLLPESGDLEGALAALTDLRDRTHGHVRLGLDLKLAELLVNKLNRGDDALSVIADVLEVSPGDPAALPIMERALSRASTRPRAAALLERAYKAAPSPAQAAAVLHILLRAPADTEELRSARRGWFETLLALETSEPQQGLTSALAAAREFPEHPSFWDTAERMARTSGSPQLVLLCYREVLRTLPDGALSDEIGRRAADFHEEWYEDVETRVALLRELFELHGSFWAFERLKLALASAGRYEEAFALYDAVIAREQGEERAALLEEAAVLAKDFARAPEQAIVYLELLHEHRPLDPSTVAALERLYERTGKRRKLLDLSIRRLASCEEGSPLAAQLRLRIASLWLSLGNERACYAILLISLREPAPSDSIYGLLGRMVTPESARTNGSVPPPPFQDPSKALQALEGHTVDELSMLPQETRHACSLLVQHHLAFGRAETCIRVLHAKLRVAEDDEERVACHQHLAQLKLSIDDKGGAFEDYAELVLLRPSDPAFRERLGEVASLLDSHLRMAEVLVDAAGHVAGTDLGDELLRDAAFLYRDKLHDLHRSSALLTRILDREGSGKDLRLQVALSLEPMLRELGQHPRLCQALSIVAASTDDLEVRARALSARARIAFHELRDTEQALLAWRARLTDQPDDGEALDGLIEVLLVTESWAELIDALTRRARLGDAARARKDLVHVAQLWTEKVKDRPRAIETWEKIREAFGKDEESFLALCTLLNEERRPGDLALLLDEQVAGMQGMERALVLTALAEVCRDFLSAPRDAAHNYARALELCPSFHAARQGARSLLDHAGARPVVLHALAQAFVVSEDWTSALSLARAIGSEEDVPEAIGRSFWWGASGQLSTAEHLPEQERMVSRALAFEPSSAELLLRLAGLRKARGGRLYAETLLALSQATGGDLQRMREACEVALRDFASDRFCEELHQRLHASAVAAWNDAGEGAANGEPSEALRLADSSLSQLASLAETRGDYGSAVQLLLESSKLPFSLGHRRSLRLRAARLLGEVMQEDQRALEVHRALVTELPGDEVAQKSIRAYAALLEKHEHWQELASLWEDQAELQTRAGDAACGCDLWHRAAVVSETRLLDLDRCVRAYDRGAELASLDCLEALARIHRARGHHELEARALSLICERSKGFALLEVTLRLSEAREQSSDSAGAIACLRELVEAEPTSEHLAARLCEMYREHQQLPELAWLLGLRAERCTDTEQKVTLMEAAVSVLWQELADPKGAALILAKLVALFPEQTEHRLALARALREADERPRAIEVLRERVALFGARRPKERALVHLALAGVLMEDDSPSAMAELQIAAKIDPAHPRILLELGDVARRCGDLEGAEQAYQGLLLLRLSKTDEPLLARHVLLGILADLAEARGDADRASELRASAVGTTEESRSLRFSAPPTSQPATERAVV